MLTSEDYEKLNTFYEENQVFRELFQAIEKDHMLSLSKISHEIRNPVTLINGFLQLMASEHPEVKSWHYWNDVMENMGFLRELLTELSQYNNAGILRPTEASPYQVLHTVVTSLTPTFAEKQITIQLEKTTPIPPFMLDTTKLREVFLNLFRNAAEAMPQGGTITCSACCDGEVVTIEIRDTGCGISPEDLPGIFDAFVTHKKDGTGLGLAIASQVIRAHQGTIKAHSQEGEGTTFTIVLPILY
jgi:signal transduction histidine kinase